MHEYKDEVLAEIGEVSNRGEKAALYQSRMKARWDALTEQEQECWTNKVHEERDAQQTYDHPDIFK